MGSTKKKATQARARRKAPAAEVIIRAPVTRAEADEAWREIGIAHARLALWVGQPDSQATLVERDAMSIIATAMYARHVPTEREQQRLQNMVDVASGAPKPGQRFDRDLAALVRLVQIARYAARQTSIDSGRMLVQLTATMTKLPVFNDLPDAGAFARSMLARGLQPSGVVTEILLAARDRGIVLGTIGINSTRDHVKRIVDNARRRYADYFAAGLGPF